MKKAISETSRRRKVQEAYNKEHNIIPKTIVKAISETISNNINIDEPKKEKYSKKEIKDMISRLEQEMRECASRLDFERATELRDIIFELKEQNE